MTMLSQRVDTWRQRNGWCFMKTALLDQHCLKHHVLFCN